MPSAAAPTYYCVFDPANLRRVRMFGYLREGAISSTYLLASNAMPSPLSDAVTADPKRELEMFLKYIYAAGVQLSSDQQFTLDADMQAAGISSHYSRINLVDWFSLTKAKVLDLTKYPDGQPRPSLTELPDGDRSNMFDIIRSLGMVGLLPHLLVPGGITFAEFNREMRHFLPDRDARLAFMTERGIPALTSRQAPLLSKQELDLIAAP